MNIFKRSTKVVEDEVDAFGLAIEAEIKKIGSEAKAVIHHDILSHAADTVASLKAKTVDEKATVEARLAEIEKESLSLLEKHRRCLAVLSFVEKGLSDLAAADAPGDPAPAPAPGAVVVAVAAAE